MRQDIVVYEHLGDAWRINLHGVIMSKPEYDLSCEIETAISRSEATAIMHALAIGLKLNKFKELLGHGRFGKWRKERFRGKDKTCQRNMLMAKHFGNHRQAISQLPLTLARELLEKENWRLLESEIMERVHEGELLVADEIRSSILTVKDNRPKRTQITPHDAESDTSVVIRYPNDNEVRAVNGIAKFLKQCDDDSLAVVLTMDSLKIGEMLIGSLLSAEI